MISIAVVVEIPINYQKLLNFVMFVLKVNFTVIQASVCVKLCNFQVTACSEVFVGT